jgi:hypothetical protein
MSITLTELLSPRNRATLEAMLTAVLQEATIEGQPGTSFPVTDWIPGSLERTNLKMTVTGLLDREDTIKMLTASGFLDLAATLVDADGNPVEGWMELLAEQWYARTRNQATYTRQLLTLTCTTGPGPYTRAAGEIIARSPVTGNRYTNEASVTIPDGGSVTAIFKAEGPGSSYVDATATIIDLVTPGLPGVTITNAATPTGVPASYITGSGSLAVTSTVFMTTAGTVKLAFTAGGRADDHTAAFTCSVYQGTDIAVTGPHTAAATFSLGDLVIGLTDGASGTQSFNVGDEWIVGIPGTPLLQAGADKEPLAVLAQRCRDRWPELSPIPTGNRYEGMVRQCETEQHLGVVKVTARPSDTIAGVENIYIAGSTSTATPAQVSAVQTYVSVHVGQVDAGNVIAATDLPIELAGIAKCRRGTLTAVQDAADVAWAAYIASLGIGGEQPEGLVRLLELENVLHDAGVYTTSGLSLNGAAADVSLTDLQCATLDDTYGLPRTGLTWQEVA